MKKYITVGLMAFLALSSALPVRAETLASRLSGRILLQVQANGEAWYVNPVDLKRTYLKDGAAAFQLLRDKGLGITNADLAAIPVGIESRFTLTDNDGDGLFNKLEQALGTNPNLMDSDSDGHNDGTEVQSGYNPTTNSATKLRIDSLLVNRLRGRILLQVQSKGEAWYLNPVDGKRYYLPDGESAYQIMRYLSLGITNADLDQISRGDEMSDWKTFNSQHFNLSFKIPGNFTADDGENIIRVAAPQPSPGLYGTTYYFFELSRYTTLTTKDKEIEKANATLKNIVQDHVMVDGASFLRITGNPFTTANGRDTISSSKIVYVFLNELDIVILGGNSQYVDGQDAIKLGDEIIATMKFLSTATWQTYSNQTYGLSFQYPNEWPSPVAGSGGTSCAYFAPDATETPYSLWSLNLGLAADGYCEGSTCYLFKMMACPIASSSYESVKAILEADQLMIKVLNTSTINGHQVIMYTEGGESGSKNAAIFGPEKMIIFTERGNEESYYNIQGTFEKILATINLQ